MKMKAFWYTAPCSFVEVVYSETTLRYVAEDCHLLIIASTYEHRISLKDIDNILLQP
jgi:hypothetical protein